MDKLFKVRFNSSSNAFNNIKFQKTDRILKETKMETGGKSSEDIYYDEIIFYDGGGVEGYGTDK